MQKKLEMKIQIQRGWTPNFLSCSEVVSKNTAEKVTNIEQPGRVHQHMPDGHSSLRCDLSCNSEKFDLVFLAIFSCTDLITFSKSQ